MFVHEFHRGCLKRIPNGCCRKDVRLPVQFQRAVEAEATREARAKVIAAEGEMRACLKEASDVISTGPAALQIRVYSPVFLVRSTLIIKHR